MRYRLGVAVSHDAVRVIGVRGGEIVWSAEAVRPEGSDLSATLGELLVAAPTRTFDRPDVFAAIGPHASQVKLLSGLPDLSDPDILGAIIRANVGTFFLSTESSLLTTGARSIGSGSALAGVVEQDTVAALVLACRAARLRLRRVAPTAVVLPLALEAEPIVWQDGAIALEIGRSERRIESIRARPHDATRRLPAEGSPVPPLVALGGDAHRFADAYGAALLDDTEPLALDPATEGSWNDDANRRRSRMTASVAGLGLLCLLLSPLSATWKRYRAEDGARMVSAQQWQLIGTSLDHLERATRALVERARFGASRISSTGLLAALSLAVPDGHLLLELELSGGTLQMVALSSDPAALLSAVRTIPALHAPAVVGPTSQQRVGALEMQRVSIRAGIIAPHSTSSLAGAQ